MKNNLNYLEIEDDLDFFLMMTTSIFGNMEDDLICLMMKDDLQYFEIEDDHNFLKWKTTPFF
jgi:hypothetical protein